MAVYNLVLNHPVDMSKSVITQGFGVNASSYSKFTVQGKPLAGHNGVDYGSYGWVAVPIWPVDDGVVEFVGFKAGADGYDPDGWGNYIDIRHSWGKSRYAHFLSIHVKVGDQVIAPKAGRATHLGDMGNTGNSSGVHLHCGVYPTGESVSNGFGGTIDQRPYTTRTFAGTPILIRPDAETPSVPPPVITPTVFPVPLKAGNAVVLYRYGLPLRTDPNSGATISVRLPLNAKIRIGGEYKDIGDIRWRKVELWVGEWQDGESLLKQA